jgi:hypothetical protein
MHCSGTAENPISEAAYPENCSSPAGSKEQISLKCLVLPSGCGFGIPGRESAGIHIPEINFQKF